jgi:hypothetical protein
MTGVPQILSFPVRTGRCSPLPRILRRGRAPFQALVAGWPARRGQHDGAAARMPGGMCECLLLRPPLSGGSFRRACLRPRDRCSAFRDRRGLSMPEIELLDDRVGVQTSRVRHLRSLQRDRE